MGNRKSEHQIRLQVQALREYAGIVSPLSPVQPKIKDLLSVLHWVQGGMYANSPMRIVRDMRDRDPRELRVGSQVDDHRKPPGLITGKVAVNRVEPRPRRQNSIFGSMFLDKK